jgi:DMSO/TMAO reductase YedYZ molybdopterin-dependent catalytic subunit
MPTTIWTLDAVPSLDTATWRLAVGDASFSYADLAALPRREVTAVLDCTGGWWSEQRWTGVRVGDLLDAAGLGGTEARVTSVTGHSQTFPVDELREALLATHLGGKPLSAEHGHPARLVAPGRRGFQWIKWVARIEVA